MILGAGFDTRAFRLPDDRVVVFEVDQPKTQAFKREMLERAGVDAQKVHFVPADFTENDWLEKLTEAGFDRDRPTFFIWESVTMYLDQPAVERTLRAIARVAAGTVVAFDYFAAELIESPSLFMRYAQAVLRAAGEPLRFGIDNRPPVRERVAALLEACGSRARRTARLRARNTPPPRTRWLRDQACALTQQLALEPRRRARDLAQHPKY